LIQRDGSEERAKDTLATIERGDGNTIAVQADVSKEGDIERMLTTAVQRFQAEYRGFVYKTPDSAQPP